MQISTLVLLLIPAVTCYMEEANFTCYSLTSPEAENIQKVYDDNQKSGVFWSRNGSGLGPCDFSSIYSTPQCSVCNDSGTIIVVLYNLTISVKLIVEGPERHISYNKTDCPQAETPDDKPGEERWIGIWVSVAFIVAVIIIIIIIIKWMRERRKSRMI